MTILSQTVLLGITYCQIWEPAKADLYYCGKSRPNCCKELKKKNNGIHISSLALLIIALLKDLNVFQSRIVIVIEVDQMIFLHPGEVNILLMAGASAFARKVI